MILIKKTDNEQLVANILNMIKKHKVNLCKNFQCWLIMDRAAFHPREFL